MSTFQHKLLFVASILSLLCTILHLRSDDMGFTLKSILVCCHFREDDWVGHLAPSISKPNVNISRFVRLYCLLQHSVT